MTDYTENSLIEQLAIKLFDDLTVKIINWQYPEQNNFLLCSQMSVTGEIEPRS